MNKFIEENQFVTNKNRNNAITGDKNYLYYRLKESFKTADKIDIIVSFLMESGVKLLIDDIRQAVERGVHIRILTGNYLKITQPSALYLLKNEFGDKIDLRFYNVSYKSFHPKSYMFHNKYDSEIYIGSSNISRGALTSSIEWNYRFLKSQNRNDYDEFFSTFEDLFNNHSQIIDDEVMKAYSQSWKRPQIYKDIDNAKREENQMIFEESGMIIDEKSDLEITPKEIEENNVRELFEPKGAQIEALYELKNTRKEGYDKGLVVAATGVGKTYLAAFDSKDAKNILFVAHREEIIKQASRSFANVRKSDDIGYFYNNVKDTNKSMIFALVQTLGKDEYLNEQYFKRDYFDYVIIDEFHHAVSGNYKKIIDYFKPKFMLGLTATPERLDSKDVFALCDYNTVYEIRLSDAINKGYLVPFRYYGIYDNTIDYEKIEFKNGKYNDKELEEALMLNRRGELIMNHYKKYNSRRAIGFCSSKKHAEYMAKYFSEKGVKSIAVYSGSVGEYSEDRNSAINKLIKGEINVLFSVDMFNEGLDIPSIDMVMFLRPTQSPTIFLQQLGRGLRKYENKKYLNVLDFIGNYKKADLLPFLLSGKEYSKVESKRGLPNEEEYPEDCRIDFDFRLVDIFKKLATKEMKIKDIIKEEYFKVKEQIGHRPNRVELFNNMDYGVYSEMKKKSTFNIFNDYLGFLKENNELTEDEILFINTRGYDFIKMIETTSMSKSYKIPVLLAFYNEGNIKIALNEEDVYKNFYEFYHKGTNKVDMLRHKSTRDFENWNQKEYIKLAKNNPIKFLVNTENNFFKKTENGLIAMFDDMRDIIKDKVFIDQMYDAILCRENRYYSERNI